LEGKVDELDTNKKMTVVCEEPNAANIVQDIMVVFGMVDFTPSEKISVEVVKSRAKKNEQNYCFYGSKGGIAAIAKGTISLGIAVVEVVADAVVCGSTLGAGCAAIPAIHFATGVGEAFAYAKIDEQFYWPNNPSLPA
jgi:hypothetical protein